MALISSEEVGGIKRTGRSTAQSISGAQELKA
jgi:hypothetical protein